jgi:CMP-2-keto-3-deoxyoctulosonic acid synthetase
LRALEAGINIHSIVTDEHPIGVDTEKDLEKAENYFRDLTLTIRIIKNEKLRDPL